MENKSDEMESENEKAACIPKKHTGAEPYSP
jgi:hypothetical protein